MSSDGDRDGAGVPPVTGDQVRAAREDRGLSRPQLAKQVGCSVGNIKFIEERRGEPVPTESRFVPLIVALLGLADPVEESPDPEALLPTELIERALRQADDALFIAEAARRMSQARGKRHDQANVSPFRIYGASGRNEGSDTKGGFSG